MGGHDKIHITFYKLKRPKGRKTDIWQIITLDKDDLGYIKFSGRWRQFIFEPSDKTIWSCSCLDQISEFLQKQNNKWKEKIKKRKIKE